MNPINEACRIRNEVENSMTDIARSGIRKFEKPEDIDVEADRLWNDPECLGDMIGDKIFWASKMMKTMEDKEMAHKICICLIQISHRAMEVAVLNFMARHNIK